MSRLDLAFFVLKVKKRVIRIFLPINSHSITLTRRADTCV
jgi:hypothetical protein